MLRREICGKSLYHVSLKLLHMKSLLKNTNRDAKHVGSMICIYVCVLKCTCVGSIRKDNQEGGYTSAEYYFILVKLC